MESASANPDVLPEINFPAESLLSPQPKNKKKRGRPPTKNSSNIKVEEAAWTTPMIETLLDEKTALKAFFLEANNKEKLSQGWSKITLAVNTDHSTALIVDQVKNKYSNLKASYRRIFEAIKKTGNAKQPKKPDHWDAMVGHFGGREGLSHSDVLSPLTKPRRELNVIRG